MMLKQKAVFVVMLMYVPFVWSMEYTSFDQVTQTIQDINDEIIYLFQSLQTYAIANMFLNLNYTYAPRSRQLLRPIARQALNNIRYVKSQFDYSIQALLDEKYVYQALCEPYAYHPLAVLMENVFSFDQYGPLYNDIQGREGYFTRIYLRGAISEAEKIIKGLSQWQGILLTRDSCVHDHLLFSTTNVELWRNSFTFMRRSGTLDSIYRFFKMVASRLDPQVWDARIRGRPTGSTFLEVILSGFNDVRINYNHYVSYVIQAILEEAPSNQLYFTHALQLCEIAPYIKNNTQDDITIHLQQLYILLAHIVAKKPEALSPSVPAQSHPLYALVRGLREIEDRFGYEQAMKYFGTPVEKILTMLKRAGIATTLPESVWHESFLVRAYYVEQAAPVVRVQRLLEQVYRSLSYLNQNLQST